MMKKSIWGIVLFVVLLMMSFPVTAQEIIPEFPVNPYQERVWAFEREFNQHPVTVEWESPVTITRKKEQDPVIGETPEWTVTYDSSHGDVTGVYIYLLVEEYDSESRIIYMTNYTEAQETVASCQIVTDGSYSFAVVVEFSDRSSGRAWDYFTVQDDAAHTSLSEKINQIVSSCQASTTWQTALNLHDWLVENLYYDFHYNYYGADAILRGYGVCDSYSKAYLMLCRAAGIPAVRVIGGNHAWNAIQLNGEWYFVDSTWDDPTGQQAGVDDVPVSGIENYIYFCVNEEVLTKDHTIAEWESDEVVCTAMDMNYYLYTGEWQNWGVQYSWATGTALPVPITDDIIAAFENGESSFTISNDSTIWYLTKSGNTKGNVKLALKKILAYGLEWTPITLNGNQFRLSVTDSPLTVTIGGWAIEETGTLTLPVNLISVQENAFYGTGATTVVIPSGCTHIYSKAFANSAVRTVTVPNSVTEIAGDAFENCGKIIFKTTNQTAIDYAAAHNMIVIGN